MLEQLHMSASKIFMSNDSETYIFRTVETHLSIISDERSNAVGFASPLPMAPVQLSLLIHPNNASYPQYPEPSHAQPQKSMHPVAKMSTRLDCDCARIGEHQELTRPMLPDGVRPNPPMRPAHMSDKMSPYKLGITMTRSAYGRGFCVI